MILLIIASIVILFVFAFICGAACEAFGMLPFMKKICWNPIEEDEEVIEDDRPEKVIYVDETHCILAINEVGPGGALHEYHITTDPYNDKEYLTSIFFQEGPIQENGVNGCQNEDLLRIVIDRLRAFQSGPFPCEENADALAHCMDAIIALDSRTANRRLRGVEGRSEA
jgi:hypothetical protein